MIAMGAWLLWSATLTLSGEDFSGVTSFSPKQDSGNLSTWLRQLPEDPDKVLGEARFEITPPEENAELLATISFDEAPGGFLKVFWTTAEGSRTLSDNFYEGIEMANRRSLLLPQLPPGEKGILTFQASQQDPLISRIQWEWLQSKAVSASGKGLDVAVLNSLGKPLDENSVSGDPASVPQDRWQGSVITAALLEKPERIEQGVEFEVDLENIPLAARVEGLLAGLPLDKNLTVWINGRPLAVTPEIPDLADEGYQTDSSGKALYIGWRKVQLLVPESWLQQGSNKLQFSWGDESSNPRPVAAKELSLQLRFADSEPLPTTSVDLSAAVSEENPILDPLPVP